MYKNDQLTSWFELRAQKEEGNYHTTNYFLGCFIDVTGIKWYGLFHPLLKEPTSIYYDLGVIGHIIEEES